MNLSYLKINYLDIQSLAKLNWNEMHYAVENKIIKDDAYVLHAKYLLDKNVLDFDIVLELSMLHDYEDVSPYVSRLLALDECEEIEEIKKKWLYIVLSYLYYKRTNYEDPLKLVEEIYVDFDYPNSISDFIRYMPTDDSSLGNNENNIERIYGKWEEFLNLNKEIYSSE